MFYDFMRKKVFAPRNGGRWGCRKQDDKFT